MRFNVAPAQGSITGATLQLTAASPNNALFNASTAGMFSIAWLPDDTWVEGTGSPKGATADGVTYNSRPASTLDQSLGTFRFDGSTAGTASYTLSLAPGFVGDLAAGGDVSLRVTAVDPAVSYLFNAREFATPASRPVLSVTTVPEPAALFVLLPAVAFAAVRRGVRGCRGNDSTNDSTGGFRRRLQKIVQRVVQRVAG